MFEFVNKKIDIFIMGGEVLLILVFFEIRSNMVSYVWFFRKGKS